MNPIVLLAAAAGGLFLYSNHKKAQGGPYTGGRPSKYGGAVRRQRGGGLVFSSEPQGQGAPEENPTVIAGGYSPNAPRGGTACTGDCPSGGTTLPPSYPIGQRDDSEPNYQSPPFMPPTATSKAKGSVAFIHAKRASYLLPGDRPGESQPSDLGGGSSNGKAFMTGDEMRFY